MDAGNQATRLVVGVYNDKKGRPGSLLATGSQAAPTANAWNTVSVGSATISSSGNYWIALLGEGGTLYFRDQANGSCTGVTSGRISGSSLPPSWSTKSQSRACPASAYVNALSPSPSNTSPPGITGKTMQGQTLAASPGNWNNSPSSYAYQWQHCTNSGCANIAGATGSNYTLQTSDVGDTTDVVVTASNSGGSASASSPQTAAVSPTPAAPGNTTLPAISGSPVQGQTLTASPGSWTGSPTSYAYQWQDCTGSVCTDIGGATGTSYAVAPSDVGDTIEVEVTATNTVGSSPASSVPTALVTAVSTSAPSNLTAPSLTGSTTVGATVSATAGTWSNSPTSYAYQWERCDLLGSNCSPISGATSSSYAITTADIAHTDAVMVTASNSAGSSSATSGATSGLGTPFDTTSRVDSAVGYYATFQSQNHRLVYTNGDIFIAYQNHWGGSSDDYASNVVAMSSNNGASWTQLLSVPCGTAASPGVCRPPSLEADSAGNVYAFMMSVTSWPTGSDTRDARMYMFPKAAGYANSGSNYLVLPSGYSGKFATAYDPAVNKLFLLTWNYLYSITASSATTASSDTESSFQFFSFDYDTANGGSGCSADLAGDTSGSYAEYPQLYVARDAADAGTVVAAWTETNCQYPMNYQDTRFIVSTDDGVHWEGRNGPITSWPILSGPSGPSWLINQTSETNAQDGPWLESIYMQDGYLDFMYSEHARDILGPETAEYAQFQLNGGSPTATTRITGGTCLSSGLLCPNHSTSGGFFSGAGTANSPIYFTTSQSTAGTINYIDTLVSTDDGATWHDYAQSAVSAWSYPYAISGAIMPGPAGEILGAFTDENPLDSTGTSPNNESVEFVATGWH